MCLLPAVQYSGWCSPCNPSYLTAFLLLFRWSVKNYIAKTAGVNPWAEKAEDRRFTVYNVTYIDSIWVCKKDTSGNMNVFWESKRQKCSFFHFRRAEAINTCTHDQKRSSISRRCHTQFMAFGCHTAPNFFRHRTKWYTSAFLLPK